MSIKFNPLSDTVAVGGNVFTVTALPLGAMRRLVLPIVEQVGVADGAFAPDVMEAMLKATHISVSRADPDITPERLENNLALADMLRLFDAVIRVSGMEGNGGAMGEPQGTQAPKGLGDSGVSSMATSYPTQAGHIPT